MPSFTLNLFSAQRQQQQQQKKGKYKFNQIKINKIPRGKKKFVKPFKMSLNLKFYLPYEDRAQEKRESPTIVCTKKKYVCT